MSTNARSIDTVLNLARTPALAPYLRAQPLPPDILILIRAAGGCLPSIETLTTQTAKSFTALKPAVSLYLQEMLFSTGADPYRNLGVERGASRDVMRTHMRWLLLWLHPDRNHHDEAHLFSAKVIKAWQLLGAGLGEGSSPSVPPRGSSKVAPSRPRVRWIAVPIAQSRNSASKKRLRPLALIAAAIVLIAAFLVPNVSPSTLSYLSALNTWAFAK